MTEKVEIAPSATPNPSLEETAAKMGIDTSKIDAGAIEQTAPPKVEQGKTAERPEHIPEKFWNAEKGEVNTDALVKSYTELERKNSGKTEEKPAVTPESKEAGKTEEKPSDNTVEQAKEAVEKAGLDFDSLSTKYWENGKLEDSDYQTLEKAGIPRHLVEQFAQGQEAIVERDRQKVFAETGGEESYKSMIAWASEAFTEAEIEAYDKIVNGNDSSATLVAVKGLKARYEAEQGFEPVARISGNANAATADSYGDISEMKADMAKPEYKTSEAFRKKVADKLSRSRIM